MTQLIIDWALSSLLFVSEIFGFWLDSSVLWWNLTFNIFSSLLVHSFVCCLFMRTFFSLVCIWEISKGGIFKKYIFCLLGVCSFLALQWRWLKAQGAHEPNVYIWPILSQFLMDLSASKLLLQPPITSSGTTGNCDNHSGALWHI